MHCQTKTDFAQAVGGWEVSRNGCFLTSTAFAREERVSDYLDAASQGQFPLPRTPTGPDTERGPVEGINGRAGWSPQDTRPGSCCWLPAEFPCVQPKTLSTKRPSIALGSPGQPQAPVPDLSCNKERGRKQSASQLYETKQRELATSCHLPAEPKLIKFDSRGYNTSYSESLLPHSPALVNYPISSKDLSLLCS